MGFESAFAKSFNVSYNRSASEYSRDLKEKKKEEARAIELANKNKKELDSGMTKLGQQYINDVNKKLEEQIKYKDSGDMESYNAVNKQIVNINEFYSKAFNDTNKNSGANYSMPDLSGIDLGDKSVYVHDGVQYYGSKDVVNSISGKEEHLVGRDDGMLGIKNLDPETGKRVTDDKNTPLLQPFGSKDEEKFNSRTFTIFSDKGVREGTITAKNEEEFQEYKNNPNMKRGTFDKPSGKGNDGNGKFFYKKTYGGIDEEGNVIEEIAFSHSEFKQMIKDGNTIDKPTPAKKQAYTLMYDRYGNAERIPNQDVQDVTITGDLSKKKPKIMQHYNEVKNDHSWFGRGSGFNEQDAKKYDYFMQKHFNITETESAGIMEALRDNGYLGNGIKNPEDADLTPAQKTMAQEAMRYYNGDYQEVDIIDKSGKKNYNLFVNEKEAEVLRKDKNIRIIGDIKDVDEVIKEVNIDEKNVSKDDRAWLERNIKQFGSFLADNAITKPTKEDIARFNKTMKRDSPENGDMKKAFYKYVWNFSKKEEENK